MNMNIIYLFPFLSAIMVTILNSIPWLGIFIFTPIVGIRLYVLHDKEICKRVQRRVVYFSHSTEGGKGYGITIGRWYFASITITRGYSDNYDIWMVATQASFDRLTSEIQDLDCSSGPGSGPGSGSGSEDATKRSNIIIYERSGVYSGFWYSKRTVNLLTTVRPTQSAIIDTICEYHQIHQHTVVFLHGPPGSGKSMICLLLAERINGSYCNTLNPWQPGDTLGGVYNEAEPTQSRPLVVAFDEFDCALVKIHAGIKSHDTLPTSTPDKAGWNRFLDEIGRGMFPHMILVLTSNRGPDFVRDLDPSYLREGRVDLTIPVN